MMNHRMMTPRVLLLVACVVPLAGCSEDPVSSSGVQKAAVAVKTHASGLTVEQENVARRLELENQPGSIKHLYVISSMSGDVILYSSVKGKVTSSGKRLSPYTIAPDPVNRLFKVDIGGANRRTTEVLQDDGTYGSSIPYLYWWDVKGVYHQHYVSGGQIIHLSDQPISVPKVILNLEQGTGSR